MMDSLPGRYIPGVLKDLLEERTISQSSRLARLISFRISLGFRPDCAFLLASLIGDPKLAGGRNRGWSEWYSR
jgi:hypothetical protein